MFEGHDHREILALVKDEKPIDELDLPRDSRMMFLYRDEKFMLPQPGSNLKWGDEAMIITHSRISKTA